jgi:hypothetical protein
MSVEHRLAGGLAIRQQHVDPCAAQTAPPHRLSNSPALPINGRPVKSSWRPGASPINIILE